MVAAALRLMMQPLDSEQNIQFVLKKKQDVVTSCIRPLCAFVWLHSRLHLFIAYYSVESANENVFPTLCKNNFGANMYT